MSIFGILYIPWWRWWDSNPWPPACRAGALPAELHPQNYWEFAFFSVCSPFWVMVGPSGLEPPTSCLSGTRSNLLSYDPMWLVWVLHTRFFQSREQISLLSLCVGIELFSRTVSRKVSSPLQSLTSVFGMGTGGPSAFVTLTFFHGSFVPWILNNINQPRFYYLVSSLVKLHGIGFLHTVRSP